MGSFWVSWVVLKGIFSFGTFMLLLANRKMTNILTEYGKNKYSRLMLAALFQCSSVSNFIQTSHCHGQTKTAHKRQLRKHTEMLDRCTKFSWRGNGATQVETNWLRICNSQVYSNSGLCSRMCFRAHLSPTLLTNFTSSHSTQNSSQTPRPSQTH